MYCAGCNDDLACSGDILSFASSILRKFDSDSDEIFGFAGYLTLPKQSALPKQPVLQPLP